MRPRACPAHSICSTCTTANHDFRQDSGLFAVVTGMEHSRTSILSEFLMNVPHLYGAIECGILLAKRKPSSFRKVQPFYKWMKRPVSTTTHWGLTDKQRNTPNEQSWNIIDKTPRYIYKLSKIIQWAPGVPIIISQKDEADQLKSFLKRTSATKARQRIHEAADGLATAQAKFPHHPIIIVNMTALQSNPDAVMTQTLAALGLELDPSYKSNEAFNAKGQGLGRCVVPPFEESAVKDMSVVFYLVLLVDMSS
eukprot:scaffold297_cov171-Amphora_coffeaeformis.AAC.17